MPILWPVALKGKNLLLLEEILPFKSRSPMKREQNLECHELLPWKVYPLSVDKNSVEVEILPICTFSEKRAKPENLTKIYDHLHFAIF